MTGIDMTADTLKRPSYGLDPERCMNPPLKRERQRHILKEALRLKIPLPLLTSPEDQEGQAVVLFGQGEAIVMDAATPVAALSDLPAEERAGDCVLESSDPAWAGLRFRVSRGSGCGVGYLGLGWSRDVLVDHLMRVYSNLDFVCLGADVSLNAMREARRALR